MFKKIFILLIAFYAVSFALPADETNAMPPTFWVVEQDTAIDTNGAFDTLTSATDSSTLLSGFSIRPGYTYVLTRDALTGTGSDSVKIIVNIDAINDNGVLVHRHPADSFTAATNEVIVLPFNTEIFGWNGNWRIMLKAYAAIGSQVILNRFYMFRMYPVGIRKDKKQRY